VTDVYVAADRRLAVTLTAYAHRRLIRHCVRAGCWETGGILIGHYTRYRDQAIVTEVTGPPVDSIRRRWLFVRGFAGVQRRIDRVWRRQDFYLGEWHFHPFASPDPSDRDRDQLRDFSTDRAYACPEPILLVIGDDPLDSPQISVGVMIAGALIPLRPRSVVGPLA